MADVRFPNVEVNLLEGSGNAFAILGKVGKALRKGGASEEEVKEFMDEAKSGDYDHLLQTCMKWAEIS